MIEPINPEDRCIPIPSWENMPLEVISSGDGQGRNNWYRPMAYKLALSEAIHQTFERDEKRTDPTYYAGGESDPDTEIDRIARLIVDGEYRRRKENK